MVLKGDLSEMMLINSPERFQESWLRQAKSFCSKFRLKNTYSERASEAGPVAFERRRKSGLPYELH